MLSLDVSAKARHQTPKATSKGTEAKRGWNRALCQFCVSLSLCFPCVPEGEVEMDLQLHAYRKEMTFPPPSASHLSLSHTYSKQTLSQAELVTDKARPSGTTRYHCQGKGREAYPCPAGPGSHLVWLLPLTEAIIVHLIHSCWAQVQQSSLNLQDVKAHFCEETDTRNTFSCRLLLHRKLQAVGSMLGALCSF